MRLKELFFFCICFPFFAWSEPSLEQPAAIPSLSIEPVAIQASKGLTTQFGFEVPQLPINFQPNNGGLGPKLNFTPNVPTKAFVAFGYGIIGGSIGWVGTQDPKANGQFGETNSIDYQFRFYLKKWNIETFFQSYQGYYLQNTGDVVTNYDSNSPRLQYPNMQTQHYGVIATYKFNSETFSASSAFDQFERQLVSGGSWLASWSLDYFSFANNTSFVPASVSGLYGGFQNLYAGNVLSASAGFGYGYNLVLIERVFLAGQAMVNIGPDDEHYNYTTGNSGSNSGLNSAEIHLKLGLGYNGERFSASARINFDDISANLPGVNMNYGATEIAFYAGYRWTEVDFPWLDGIWENK